MPAANRRAGLTLAELLVVIGIVAALSAAAWSVVGSVRRYAWRAGCMSNLRQIYAAALLYAGDHAAFPAEGNKGVDDPLRSPAWFHRLPPYVQARDVRGKHSVFQCPSYQPRDPTVFDHASPKSLKFNARLDDHGRAQHYRPGSAADESSIVFFATAVAGETGMGQWGHLVPSAVDAQRLGVAVILWLDGHITAERPPADGRWDRSLRFTSRSWEP